MTANQKISLVLLLGRILTVYLMSLVIRKQSRFLKARSHPELYQLRRRLLLGSIVVLAGNVVPIVIDTMGVFNKGSFGLLLAYVFSNNLTAIISAYLLWSTIRLSEKLKVANEVSKKSE